MIPEWEMLHMVGTQTYDEGAFITWILIIAGMNPSLLSLVGSTSSRCLLIVSQHTRPLLSASHDIQNTAINSQYLSVHISIFGEE
jgi:hypothetical protein